MPGLSLASSPCHSSEHEDRSQRLPGSSLRRQPPVRSLVWSSCLMHQRKGHHDPFAPAHHSILSLAALLIDLGSQDQKTSADEASAAWLAPAASLSITGIHGPACARSWHWSASLIAVDSWTRTIELCGSSARSWWSLRILPVKDLGSRACCYYLLLELPWLCSRRCDRHQDLLYLFTQYHSFDFEDPCFYSSSPRPLNAVGLIGRTMS
jgi:hypothetical protein